MRQKRFNSSFGSLLSCLAFPRCPMGRYGSEIFIKKNFRNFYTYILYDSFSFSESLFFSLSFAHIVAIFLSICLSRKQKLTYFVSRNRITVTLHTQEIFNIILYTVCGAWNVDGWGVGMCPKTNTLVMPFHSNPYCVGMYKYLYMNSSIHLSVIIMYLYCAAYYSIHACHPIQHVLACIIIM